MLEQTDVNFLATWLHQNGHTLKLMAVGALGSSVRVALGMAAGEPLRPSVVFATVTTGIFLCTTTSGLIAAKVGVGAEWTIPLGFVISLQGMKAVQIIMDLDWKRLAEAIFNRILSRFTPANTPPEQKK